MTNLRDFTVDTEGWTGVIKYRQLNPFDRIRASKVIAGQDLERIAEIEKQKIDTGKSVMAPEHFDFLEAGMKFALPFIESVDVTSPEGAHFTDAQAFLDDGDNLEVLSAFAMQVIIFAFAKKKPIEMKKPGKSSKAKPVL